ncbi:MAG TPA: membrane protein insertase YidC [Phycisphaerales bacterium]|nr:membrane protein insertase YidC [Phycisphaerales bacterium]
MPASPPNKLLRLIVPLIVAAVAGYFAYSIFVNTSNQPAKRAANQPPAAATTQTAATQEPAPSSETTKEGPKPADPQSEAGAQAADPASASPAGSVTAPSTSASTPSAQPTTGNGVLRAKTVPAPSAGFTPIGDVGEGSPKRSQLRFALTGAGVESIAMAEEYSTIGDKLAKNPSGHYELQHRGVITDADGKPLYSVTSLGALRVVIDGRDVNLYGTSANPVWTEQSPGVFVAEIENETGSTVARITRTYEQPNDSFEFTVRQSFENLTDRPMEIRWVQYGPIDLHEEFTGYRIDARRVRFGYLLDLQRDPSQSFVEADTLLLQRQNLIPELERQVMAGGNAHKQLWPDPANFKGAGKLSWLAQTSRYFTLAVHPVIPAGAATPDKSLKLASEVHATMIGRTDPAHPDGGTARLAMEMHSEKFAVPASGSADLSFAVYAGPMARSELTKSVDPVFGALGLRGLVMFNLGGMCAFCTFQWLANILFDYLHLLHDYLVFDWALAIMLLVLTVRTILHPITKRSQIAMQRFGKQMQALAPKQKKLQEMYKNDPARLRQEMARLMKEENVNYAGALGCFPMFLQTPVWIALYAMLYFAFELRHQPAYYGLFQALSAGKWTFLADLSSPDRFFVLPRHFSVPLMGDISSINVLPVVLGIVFFIQQKYLTPPPSASMTPEQETQQKIMKWMMVFLFPFMMYNAPSGLAIYFITNSTLGILESRYIRAHIDQLDKNPPPVKNDGRKWVENRAGRK